MLDEESWSSFLSVASRASPVLVARSPLAENYIKNKRECVTFS
jgi:hypothetical protein